MCSPPRRAFTQALQTRAEPFRLELPLFLAEHPKASARPELRRRQEHDGDAAASAVSWALPHGWGGVGLGPAPDPGHMATRDIKNRCQSLMRGDELSYFRKRELKLTWHHHPLACLKLCPWHEAGDI